MLSRKEQASLAKESIIEATKNLIREKGYDKIRIEDITSACSMSKGNFYNYYRSKDELFNEIDTTMFYEMLNALNPDMEYTIAGRVEAFFLEWVNLMIDHFGANYSYHWGQHYANKVSASDEEMSRTSIIYRYIMQILKTGVENNELRNDTPAECIAYTIAFSIFGFSVHFGITDDADSMRQWAKKFCQVYIHNALTPYQS